MATNHPNTLIDAILNGQIFCGRLNFLTNTGLYQHPIARAFFKLHFTIPIKRKRDPELKGYSLERSFQLTTQALNKKKAIFIAAEGTSLRGHVLRPIRYGAEKIIEDFVAQTDKEIQLICNILSYQRPDKFRSFAVVENARYGFYSNAIKEGSVTNEIEKGFAENLIILPEFDMDDADRLFSHAFPEVTNSGVWKPLFHQLATAITGNTSRVSDCKRFLNSLKASGIKPGTILSKARVQTWSLFLVLSAVLYPISFIAGWIPRQLTKQIVKWINTDKEYESTIKLSTGPFLYLFYIMILLFTFSLSFWFILPTLFGFGILECFRAEYNWYWSRVRAYHNFRKIAANEQSNYLQEINKIKSWVKGD